MNVLINVGGFQYNAELFDNKVAKAIRKRVPIEAPIRVFGEEIYIIVDYKLPDDPDAKMADEFKVGDIIYWKSQKSDKEAIALYFGNCPIGDGTKPRSPSPATLIGQFSFGEKDIQKLTNEMPFSICVESN